MSLGIDLASVVAGRNQIYGARCWHHEDALAALAGARIRSPEGCRQPTHAAVRGRGERGDRRTLRVLAKIWGRTRLRPKLAAGVLLVEDVDLGQRGERRAHV